MDIPVAHNDTAIVPVQMVAGSTLHLGVGACNFLLIVPCEDLVALAQHLLTYLIPHTLSPIRGVAQETWHPLQ